MARAKTRVPPAIFYTILFLEECSLQILMSLPKTCAGRAGELLPRKVISAARGASLIGEHMSNTNFGEHELPEAPESGNVSAVAGFETAVFEYENCWIAFEVSRKSLDTAHMMVQLASGRLEEATLSLDEIATEFNDSSVDDPEFEQLMELLDIARDYMIEASDDYNAANAELLAANDQYEADHANIDEALAIARELRDELHSVAGMGDPAVAANDDEFETQKVMEHLSDNAKHFYRCAA